MSSIMGYKDEDAETAINLALGAASVCWDTDGVFQSDRAKTIAEELVEHLRKLRLLPEEFTTRCGICYRDVSTLHGAASHTIFPDDSVRCWAEPDRAHGPYISGFAIPVAPQHDRRKQERAERTEVNPL